MLDIVVGAVDDYLVERDAGDAVAVAVYHQFVAGAFDDDLLLVGVDVDVIEFGAVDRLFVGRSVHAEDRAGRGCVDGNDIGRVDRRLGRGLNYRGRR